MSYRRWLFRASTISLLLWANSSFIDSDFVPNQPLRKLQRVHEPRDSHGKNSDSLLFILSLSGGGTRSAALSFGALQALRQSAIQTASGPRPALEELDTIFAVSGGAFTAAYYGLYGDKIFNSFEQRFLRRNLNIDFPPAFARINVIKKLLRKDVGRSEAMVSYLDDLLFSGHTVDELLDDTGPKVEISASDLASGSQFTFSDQGLNSICSDARSIPVARAITASSAVPLLYSPIRLNNYAAYCTPAGPAQGGAGEITFPPRQRFIHLADGGLTDNTGLRPFLEKVKYYGGVQNMLEHEGRNATRKIILLYVDASVTPDSKSGLNSQPMSAGSVIKAATKTMIRQYSEATLSRVRQVLSDWTIEMARRGKPVTYELIHMSFNNLTADQERYFNNVPTSFALSDENVDRLIATGARLVRKHRVFRMAASSRNALPSSAE